MVLEILRMCFFIINLIHLFVFFYFVLAKISFLKVLVQNSDKFFKKIKFFIPKGKKRLEGILR